MSKILCIISLVISAIIFIIFLLNLIVKMPFGDAGGIVMNICMILASGIIGAFSVLTFLETR